MAQRYRSGQDDSRILKGVGVRLALLLLVALVLTACAPPQARKSPPPLTVSAASSLTFAFQELAPRFEERTGIPVTFNFGATGQLAQQIENGAPVDAFAAAHISFVEQLADQGFILRDTITVYGRGRLVLWQRADSPLRVETLKDLRRPEIRRVAIANPEHAPYGVAARQALQAAGVWDQVQPKLVIAGNVRQALQYAETGNVDVALVALTLALQAQGGRWVLLPEEQHAPIEQAIAVVAGSPREEAAREFVRFVSGPEGQAVLRRYGLALSAGGRQP